MIESPVQDPRRTARRAVVEALAQATPITAGLARLYQFTHASEMERAVDEWRDEVSNTLNTHEAVLHRIGEKIAPRLRIGETALELALWVTRASEDGMITPIGFDEVQAAFEDIDKSELEEACSELEHLGFASLSAATLRPTGHLFWTFDPTVHGTDPTTDAAEIARMMLEDESLCSIPKLDTKLGWPKRRLNPAVARLMPFVTNGRTRQVIQNEYPTLGFSFAPEDRFKLRRFIEDMPPESPPTSE